MRQNEANLSGKMCIGYIRCRRGLTRAFGLDAACSVRLTAASASEGQRMDANKPGLADPKRDRNFFNAVLENQSVNVAHGRLVGSRVQGITPSRVSRVQTRVGRVQGINLGDLWNHTGLRVREPHR